MRIGRIKNDMKWNYGFAFERDMSRGEGYVFAIWFCKQTRLVRRADQVMPKVIGFHKRIHLL